MSIRDVDAAVMVATMSKGAIRTWLSVQADRNYADDMRQRLNRAWSAAAAGDGATCGEICDYFGRDDERPG